MCDLEIIIERTEFVKFLITEKNALEENSITIARSKNYDVDGLKFVIDYDEDHYSFRIENFDTSDIELRHLYDSQVKRTALKFYDSLLNKLAKIIKPSHPSPTKMQLDLGFAKLVVEVYNSDYPVPEVIICLDDGSNLQDIAIVRQAISDSNEKQDSVECLVYADECTEDYTNRFNIKHYKYEE